AVNESAAEYDRGESVVGEIFAAVGAVMTVNAGLVRIAASGKAAEHATILIIDVAIVVVVECLTWIIAEDLGAEALHAGIEGPETELILIHRSVTIEILAAPIARDAAEVSGGRRKEHVVNSVSVNVEARCLTPADLVARMFSPDSQHRRSQGGTVGV